MSGSNTQVDTSNDGTIDFKQDVFGTLEGYADNLTKLLLPDNITGGGRVLNVDGGWGTGKTFFIERWANKLRDDGYAVVKFNAWENDSAEDPLGPLLASIHEQLKGHIDEAIFEGVKAAAGKLVWSAVKVGVNVVVDRTVGQKSKDDVLENIQSIRSGISDVAASKYIDDHIDKLKQQKALHDSLKELAKKIQASGKCQTPVWIFVDELDRCRPSFAVELLERVKHCFDLKGFRFVFATNTGELVHSIKVLYGQEFDAYIYLQRFFEHTSVLPAPENDVFAMMLLEDLGSLYTEEGILRYDFCEGNGYDFSHAPFALFARKLGLCLRQQEQAVKYLCVCLEQLLGQLDESLKIHIVLLSYFVCAAIKYPVVCQSDLNMRNCFDERWLGDKLPGIYVPFRIYKECLYDSENSIMRRRQSLECRGSGATQRDKLHCEYLSQYKWIRKHLEVFMFAGEMLGASVGSK